MWTAHVTLVMDIGYFQMMRAYHVDNGEYAAAIPQLSGSSCNWLIPVDAVNAKKNVGAEI